MTKQNLEIVKTTDAYKVEIFIGGSVDMAKDACLEFCTREGLCVTVTPTTYIYRGGACEGVVVGLINYARFPNEEDIIFRVALRLARVLKAHLNQGSYTVQDYRESLFFSTRDEDQTQN